MVMANTTGWQLLCPFGFSITWNGGQAKSDIVVTLDDQDENKGFAVSLFGGGMITLKAGYLFRTEPGWDLYFMGPPNSPKHQLHALSGIVETTWLPYTSAINWKFTSPGTVRFEKGEPFGMFMPVPHAVIDDFEIIVQPLEGELLDEYNEWSTSRTEFMNAKKRGDAKASRQQWQKHYYLGTKHDGTKVEDHINRRRLKKPKKTT